ncbi:HD domain-containing protein [Sporosarcina limicola]|uniref:5'-deoxynucleotidase n=1 Tax=Sporosarcina limicola TaxID=34101 RepID=A0A927MLM3_9BACL|nr:HD domain-containing protein [Sporosarcina limicola]MBE1556984.1 putative hydrolase of HD superfamily [Sporosarcina limicola]
MKRLRAQLSFCNELEKLKSVTRFNRTLDSRYENSAEHSWQVALVAVLLREYYDAELNMEIVLELLLIHDLGEIYAGDTWVFDDSKKNTSSQRELNSISKSITQLPNDQKENILNLWNEFEFGVSSEARYARVIDALVPLINHLEVSEENFNPDNITAQMVLKKKEFIKNESDKLWRLTKELIEASIEKGLYIGLNETK